MTHIEQMIQDMCPNGVEWKTFDELGAFYGGLSGKTKDDFKEGNEKFITYLNIANNPALRLDIDETVKIGPNEKQNIVQYGDALFTGSSETPDECAMSSVVTDYPQEKLYLNSFCFGFRFNSLEGICPAFYKHYFRSDHFRKAVRRTANGTTRFNVSKKEFGKLAIPLPPLEIQKKIVECLDKFSALAAELQAELQMRRKQYEYYRTQLLTPHSDCNSATKPDDAQWEWKTLGEICEIRNGKDYKHLNDGKYPVYGSGGIMTYKDQYVYNKPSVLLPRKGSINKIHYVEEPFWNVDTAFYTIINESVVLPKYLFYYLSTIDLAAYNTGTGAIPSLTQTVLKALSIPIPPLAEQERIVSILDKFEALTTSLSNGIPAEQVAQQKRYEYYRDLLLTFDRKAV